MQRSKKLEIVQIVRNKNGRMDDKEKKEFKAKTDFFSFL